MLNFWQQCCPNIKGTTRWAGNCIKMATLVEEDISANTGSTLGTGAVDIAGATEDKLPSFRWIDSNIEKLIDLLKANPCLYDTTLKVYHDRNKKRSAHTSIAADLGITGIM